MKYDTIDFFNYGKSACHAAKLLFKEKYQFESTVLFIHGLELLLKAFIILQTGHKPPAEYNVIKLFKKCRKLGADDIFTKGTGKKIYLIFFPKNLT